MWESLYDCKYGISRPQDNMSTESQDKEGVPNLKNLCKHVSNIHQQMVRCQRLLQFAPKHPGVDSYAWIETKRELGKLIHYENWVVYLFHKCNLAHAIYWQMFTRIDHEAD